MASCNMTHSSLERKGERSNLSPLSVNWSGTLGSTSLARFGMRSQQTMRHNGSLVSLKNIFSFNYRQGESADLCKKLITKTTQDILYVYSQVAAAVFTSTKAFHRSSEQLENCL